MIQEKTFNIVLDELREQYKKDLIHYKETGIKSSLMIRIEKCV